MTRPRRIHVDGGIYHITLRGNHRERIFHGPEDFDRFERLLANLLADYQLRVHAFCWMPNHVHLAMQVGPIPLARPMARLASTFARQQHQRVPTTGHLFERRYFAALVDSERYLFKLVQYIHLNPVRAGIVTTPGQYRWSSHRHYLGLVNQPWLTTNTLLAMLANDTKSARLTYLEWMGRELEAEDIKAFWNGEPRRMSPLNGTTTTHDAPSGTSLCPSFDAIAAAISTRFGLPVATLYGKSRRREVVIARAAVAVHAVRHNICSMSDAARRMGRSPGTVSAAIAAVRRRDPALLSDCGI